MEKEKSKIKIDLTRHLCDTCKKSISCEFEEFEVGDAQNVIRCKKYLKRNENKLKPRVQVGDLFYHYVYKDQKNPKLGFKPKARTENKDRIDNLLHEIGNYYASVDDCQVEIDRLTNNPTCPTTTQI